MAGLQLAILGTFEAAIDGRPVTGFATDKVRALLAYLALAPDRAHDRLELATLLWSEHADAAALTNLRKSLWRLSQALDAVGPGTYERLLLVSRQAVVLQGGAIDTDAVQFRALLAEAAAHRHAELHTCRECLERLETAVALYRGELLLGVAVTDADVFEEWLALERETFHQALMTALDQLTAAYLRRGDGDRAAEHAARRLAAEPWHEEAHRQRMAALALAGRRSEALAQYEACRGALARELGVAPAPETRALYEEIRDASAASGETARAARLRNFPAQFTPFVGREDVLLTLQAQLQDPSCRLLTLVGPGGAGKTRLAIQAAEQLAAGPGAGGGAGGRPLPRDGIGFVNLAGVSAPELVPATIAAALGLTFRDAADPREQLLGYLAGKELLVVLDNFEQLMGAVDLVADLLAAAPGLRLLVTSRVPLRLGAERRVMVGGLDFPSGEQVPEAGLEWDAVRLFRQAAQHYRPGQAFSAAELSAVNQICRLVDGLPLAIEIAASWLHVHDCATIAAEIARSQRFLVSRVSDLDERQRSIGAVFDHSWALLSPDERGVLASCAVFRDPFHFDAAQAVAGARAEDLARLVEQGLVRRTTDGRFDLHVLAREFAAERLERGEPGLPARPVVEARHGEHFLRWLAALEPALFGRAPQQSVAAAQAALNEIRGAWAWAVAEACLDLLGLSLEALARCYWMLGLSHEAVETFQRTRRALDAAGEESGAADQARRELASRLATWQASYLTGIGHHSQAQTVAAEAVALANELAVPLLQARALNEFSHPLLLSGDYDEAHRAQQASIELALAAGDPRTLATCRGRLGIIYLRTGHAAEALPLMEEVLRQAEALQDTVMVGSAHGNVGVCHLVLMHPDEALAHNKAALRVAQELGLKAQEAIQIGNLGILRFQMGDDEGALTCLDQALAVDESLGNRHGVARHHANLGHLYRRRGEPAQALEHYDRALELLVQPGARSFLHSLLIDKAEALFALGDIPAAKAANAQGMASMTELGHHEHVVQGRLLAARILNAEGQRPEAVQDLEALLGIVDDDMEQATLHYELWRLGQGDEHGRAAAALYRDGPFYEARTRMVELRGAGLARPA